jgi:lipoprotein-releasing system ATP-binding protein
MLIVNNVTKSFTGRGLVLDNLDLIVNEGDSIAVTGPSGSGKTTLMNIIGLLDKPDSGDVLFMDKSILGFTPDESAKYRNRNIGFVFQDHLLLPHLNVEENIILCSFAYGENRYNKFIWQIPFPYLRRRGTACDTGAGPDKPAFPPACRRTYRIA